MKQLPKYALLSGEGFEGIKVIMLEEPFFIASIYEAKRDEEKIENFMEAMVQERYPVGKVKGYSIFLTMYSSLQPNNDFEFQREVLNEMGEYFLENKIMKKPGFYRMSEESGKAEKAHERAKQHAMRMRERKKANG